MNYFFVDAETDGLYGSFLSVAALVTDSDGVEIDLFYGALKPEKVIVREDWVRENVLPYLGRAHTFFDSEEELLAAFWELWMKHRETCACVADVCYPVEARLFSRCVMIDEANRAFLGPYPLLDLSTLIVSRGIDPMTPRTELTDLKLRQHDALNDVRIAEDIWRRLTRA